jgi:hypothetical protein
MTPEEQWKWLKQFTTLLEEQALAAKDNPEMLAKARVGERVLNMQINQLMNRLHKEGKPPVNIWLTEEVKEEEGAWNKLKTRRDRIAGSVSDRIEETPQAKERFEQLCETMKNIRILGSLL